MHPEEKYISVASGAGTLDLLIHSPVLTTRPLFIYVSGSSNSNDIHRITCQLRWVWLTPTG